MIIKLDEVEVPRVGWDEAIPVDPGNRQARAEASGYTSWSKSASVTEPGKTVTVDVPALVAVPVLWHGVVQSLIAYVQKPITPDVLTTKVREVLDAADATTAPTG
jgi:hypothetical protein